VALDSASEPHSPNPCIFASPGQPLVDAAFLAQGLLRPPTVPWEPRHQPAVLNWLLFAATIETALFVFGAEDWDRMRIDHALRQHEQWYKGDGIYGDGPHYHADYYNSFVIHPMLVDIIWHSRGEEAWGVEERNADACPDGCIAQAARRCHSRSGAAPRAPRRSRSCRSSVRATRRCQRRASFRMLRALLSSSTPAATACSSERVRSLMAADSRGRGGNSGSRIFLKTRAHPCLGESSFSSHGGLDKVRA
jgi:hypothetical protein